MSAPASDALLARGHWIFDLDGTLTRPQHDFAAIRAALGVPAECGILEFIEAQSAPLQRRLNQRLGEIERGLARRAEPNPGALALLEGLAGAGVRLGIFTRNRRECVQITLERLGCAALFSDAAVVACEDGLPKPHPAGIERLLQQWRSPASDALIVGDFRYDLEAGRAAGIATVLLACTPERCWPELTDLRIGSLEELALRWRAATRRRPE